MCNISAGFFRDGMVEGISKERTNIIKTMLGKKLTIQEITELTNIPIEEVKKVQKSLTP